MTGPAVPTFGGYTADQLESIAAAGQTVFVPGYGYFGPGSTLPLALQSLTVQSLEGGIGPQPVNAQGLTIQQVDQLNTLAQQTGSSVNPIITVGGPSWLDGLTNNLQSGYPPDGWVESSNGYFYPPSVIVSSAVAQSTTQSTTVTTSTQLAFNVIINVLPNIPQYATDVVINPTTLLINPIPLQLSNAILQNFNQLSNNQINDFFDITREGKTLLNFGLDYQALITNWQYDSSDPTLSTIDVKLYVPLPTEVALKSQLWVTREVTPPVIDRIYERNSPVPAPLIYLRPANMNITLCGQTGQTIQNVTLGKLLSSGSFTTPYPSDPVIQQWYTTDINSADLNINYADYRKFVIFGSATSRLNAFLNKLLLLENYNSLISMNSSSLATVWSTPTGALAYPSILNIAEQKIDLLRTFDGYERFLYYDSNISYSSSLSTNDINDAIYYNSDCTYPKISGSAVPVASASVWIGSQATIAQAYDAQNINAFALSIPQYLQQDSGSLDYLQFVKLIGHHFDNIKVYIDAMGDIYDRQSDPTIGLSEDLIWNIAQGFGIDLPNQYAINNLVDYTIGDITQVNPIVYHEVAAETWKRFLHNQIYTMKTKGTAASLRSLANSYGILPTTLQIREGTSIAPSYVSGTFETFEQQTNALNFVSGSYIDIPWTNASNISSSTVEIRFATTNNNSTTVLNSHDGNIGICLVPLTGSYGTVIVSGSNGGIVSSSYLPIYSGDFYYVMVQNVNNKVGLYVEHANQENIDYSSITFETGSTLANSWYNASHCYIGTSKNGSSFGNAFIGQIDEVRIWQAPLNTIIFEDHVLYPGLYNGNNSGSALTDLTTRLSFSIPVNLFTTQSVYNESPFSASQQFTASGFPNEATYPYNCDIILRTVTRYTPNAGNQFTTDNITIAPPAQVNSLTLNVSSSIVSINDKIQNNKVNQNVVGFYFSLTDAINDSIIRSIGNINLQNLIGDPADQFNYVYSNLLNLDNLYWNDYSYIFNQNQFIEFVENLLEPLFIQAKQLIPVRAKLISGIVHEPHILERSKFPGKKVIVSAGTFTKYDKTDNQNLSTRIKTSATTHVSGSKPIYSASFQTHNTTKPKALYQGISGSTHATNLYSLKSVYENYYTSASVNKTTKPKGTLSTYSTYTLAEGNSISVWNDVILPDSITLNSFNSSSGISSFVKTIYPYTNFNKIENITYFNNINGIVGTEQINYILNNKTLNYRGTWATGTSYNKFDYVLDSVSGSQGSGSYFQFTPSAGNSYIDPYVDVYKWTNVSRTSVISFAPRYAVIISGSVSLAVSSGSYTVANNGYFSQLHYYFTQDHETGTKRHNREGCKQTQLTTLDGSSPIQIQPSPQNELIVVGGSNNIQQGSNVTGPILNVEP